MSIELQIHVRNLNACVLTCKEWKHAGNQITCNHNQKTIQANAMENRCPHPTGTRFVGEPAEVPLMGTLWAGGDHWSVAGPLLWKELHRWTLTAHLEGDRDWIKNFLAKIACGECKDHAIEYLAQYPPDFSSRQKLFAWGVDFHNAVNARLEKRQFTVEEAMQRWTANVEPPRAELARADQGCKTC